MTQPPVPCVNAGCTRPGRYTIFTSCPVGHRRQGTCCDTCTNAIRHHEIGLYCFACPKPRPKVNVDRAMGPLYPDAERHRKMTGKQLPSEACLDSPY